MNRRWRLLAAVFLAATTAVSCGSSSKPANKGSGNGGDFTNRPAGNGTNGGVTTSSGSSQQGGGQ